MKQIYDILGVGLGPFNLSLAALSEPLKDVKSLFLDQQKGFDWHPGMLLEGTHLQVPFMADLVTMADPCSAYSVLNYLKKHDRLYPFYIRENFFLLRNEYNKYCQWVCEELSNVKFSHQVKHIRYSENEQVYEVLVIDLLTDDVKTYYAKNIVLGTGTIPSFPVCCKAHQEDLIHTSNYLFEKKDLIKNKVITIVGGGQSAAEIYYDLLSEIDEHRYQLNWVTRSARFFPLEYSKITLEMTSPEYVDYFHNLPEHKRDKLNKQQQNLYKGINFDLINDIYDLLYTKSVEGPINTKIYTNSTLEKVQKEGGEMLLSFHHNEQERNYDIKSNAVVMATGYQNHVPKFIEPLKNHIQWDGQNRYAVNRNYSIDTKDSIFVQNAELHTHGFVSPDLGMGAYRSAYILKEITGKEHYKVEQKIAFQEFGVSQSEAVETLICE